MSKIWLKILKQTAILGCKSFVFEFWKKYGKNTEKFTEKNTENFFCIFFCKFSVLFSEFYFIFLDERNFYYPVQYIFFSFFRYRRGNDPHHFREEYLSQKAHNFKAKVRWGDSYEGQGEHFYDINHSGPKYEPAPAHPSG